MATTALVVELLVVGMQALVRLLPLISLFSPSMAAALMDLRSVSTPWLVAFSLAGVYTLGVLADTAARGTVLPMQLGKALLKLRWVSRIADRAKDDIRIRILAREGKVDTLINYYVVRTRVLRGITFNSNLAWLLWTLAALFNRSPIASENPQNSAIFVGLATLAIALVSGVTYALDQAGYLRRLEEIERIVSESRSDRNK